MIPEKDPSFVPNKTFKALVKILKSKKFYPIFLAGETGYGKTTDIIQAVAYTNREVYRANITIETDESDLIGAFTLQDGNTVFEYGPVVQAMRKGAVLFLDEIDLGSTRIMCLQSVLEGKSIYIKKTGETIHPAPGFTVMATGNSKGNGSDDYIGAQFMNKALLGRFKLFMDVNSPSKKEEIEILTKYAQIENIHIDQETIENLVQWAYDSRMAKKGNAVYEEISTRRLKSILDYFNIFGGKIITSIKANMNEFDTDTVDAFIRFWNIVNGIEVAEENSEDPVNA